MTIYKLINPTIIGKFKTSYQGKTAIEAGNKFWVNLTSKEKLITNNVPRFVFTMKDNKDNLYNFLIKESIDGKYKIKELDLNIEEDRKNKLLEESKKIKIQKGGRRHRHHDDSSSDSDSYYGYYGYPISYWWYYPYLYYNVYRDIYLPTFRLTSPYVILLNE